MGVLKWVAAAMGGLFGLCLLTGLVINVFSPETTARYARERVAREAQQKKLETAQAAQEAEDAKRKANLAPELSAQFTRFAKKLPSLEQLEERACPATMPHGEASTNSWTKLPYVDSEFFGLLDAANEPIRPHAIRSHVMEYAGTAIQMARQGKYFRTASLTQASAVLNGLGLVPVIFTEDYVPPKLYADKRTFRGGWFKGWLVLVKWPSGELLCATQFSATSSDKTGGILSAASQVEIDIEVQVERALENAYARLRRTAEQANARQASP